MTKSFNSIRSSIEAVQADKSGEQFFKCQPKDQYLLGLGLGFVLLNPKWILKLSFVRTA